MDAIIGILFLIVWIPLTIFICSKLAGSTTVISLDGLNGLFTGYLQILILSGVIAAAIIVIPFWFLGGLLDFIWEHWEIFLAIGMGVYYLFSKGSKAESDDKEENKDKEASDDKEENKTPEA